MRKIGALVVKKIEDSLAIDRPVEEVYAFLSTAENHAAFIPGMLEFEQTTPGSFAQAGARARGRTSFLGLKMDVRYEITGAQMDKELSMSGVMGPVTFEDGYILDGNGAGTTVRFWLVPRLTGLMRLASPLVRLIGRTHAAETLAGLKAVLGAEPMAVPANAR